MKKLISVDFRRMFTMSFFYIMLGISFVMPILILVMTTMAGGEPENAGAGFTNVWQAVGTVSGASQAAQMDMTSMCNINLLFFMAAVVVSVFVSADFKSGYAKNIFSIRSTRKEYVVSKAIVCFLANAAMLIAFFVGSMLGGAIAGLPFEMIGFNGANLVMSMIAKIGLMGVFVAIYLLASVVAKSKTWLSTVISFVAGMLMFMMIPAMTPLNATIIHAGLCLAGCALFNLGLGAVSNLVLKKSDLI